MKFGPIIGGLLSMSFIMVACLLGASGMVFFDTPTLMLVFTLPLAFLVQAHGWAGLKTVARAVKCWLDPENVPPRQLTDACCVVQTGSRATIHCAHIPIVIGAIQMLQHGALESIDELGPAMAVALLTYFYAHCINFVFWGPLSRWLRQHADARAAVAPARVAESGA